MIRQSHNLALKTLGSLPIFFSFKSSPFQISSPTPVRRSSKAVSRARKNKEYQTIREKGKWHQGKIKDHNIITFGNHGNRNCVSRHGQLLFRRDNVGTTIQSNPLTSRYQESKSEHSRGKALSVLSFPLPESSRIPNDMGKFFFTENHFLFFPLSLFCVIVKSGVNFFGTK